MTCVICHLGPATGAVIPGASRRGPAHLTCVDWEREQDHGRALAEQAEREAAEEALLAEAESILASAGLPVPDRPVERSETAYLARVALAYVKAFVVLTLIAAMLAVPSAWALSGLFARAVGETIGVLTNSSGVTQGEVQNVSDWIEEGRRSVEAP